MSLANGSNVNNLKNEHIDDGLLMPDADQTLQKAFISFAQQSDKSKFELNRALDELTATYKQIIKDNLG